MREVDTAPILAKLDAWKGKSQHHIAYMHQLERWRDRLMENDSALTELLAAHPQADGAASAHADPQRAEGNGGGKTSQELPGNFSGAARNHSRTTIGL